MGATTLRLDGREHLGAYDGEKATLIGEPFRKTCGKCGANRIDQQIGLEPSPDEYVAALVSVFREVRRVLRRDGTLWLNVGDSYAGATPVRWRRIANVKPKDLIGIPWMVAFALRADGWYLRQDNIWSKPNPMPESATDRCTSAHEYLFLLSRSERYFYDAAAISEDATARRQQRLTAPTEHPKAKLSGGQNFVDGGISTIRNKRSVWTVATQPFAEAHFATFPPALIEPCIKAGCPVGGTVLDPFGGAGTTGLVADRLQRNAVLIELNPAYVEIAKCRITDDAPLFAEIAA
jgi:DNA modification methylase